MSQPQQDKSATPGRLVPIIPSKRSSKWNRTMYKSKDPFVVTFNTVGKDEGWGISFQDLTLRSLYALAHILVDANECIRFPSYEIKLRVVWPGYESVAHSTTPFVPHRMSRSEVAGRIAEAYERFFELASKHQCTEPDWVITPEVPKALYIVSLRNQYENIYQAEVVLRDPTPGQQAILPAPLNSAPID